MKFFTLHIRLTRDCNAHCDYCSSAGVAAGRMRHDDFKRAIDFIADKVLPRIGVGKSHHLTIEYLGGEVLLIPEDELIGAVEYARNRFRPFVAGLRDGAQSNLIGSGRRVLALHDLFRGNLGTSWDRMTDRRKVAGSAELYRALLNKSIETLAQERSHHPGRVIVVDAAMSPHLEHEVSSAIEGGYDLVLRPVFQGGSQGVEHINVEDLAELMARCYDIWRQSPTVRIEPFSSLLQRRVTRGRQDAAGHPASLRTAGCPFQSDCAFRSLSLDPDGTLHICQEMADAGNYPLGNAITENFDENTWRLLARRTARLSSDCAACRWRDECGGGCMNEAIEAHGDPFAKTELCQVWKSIFAHIEDHIATGINHEILEEGL